MKVARLVPRMRGFIAAQARAQAAPLPSHVIPGGAAALPSEWKPVADDP